MAQLFIGLIAEGTTDYRFFEPIIEKTLIDIAYECKGQIDIDVKAIYCDKGDSFSDYILDASKTASQELGITMLIVHTDADDESSAKAYSNKINPTKALLEQKSDDTYCKKLIALIPIHETESWMLADKTVFIKSIGTKKNENELNISGNPESFNNPKARIVEAIRIGRADMPKKMRDNLKISELYSYLGQAIHIDYLKTFQSYRDFENNIRQVLIELNLLDS
ncbi:MAG: hypothetical protein ABS44_09635 [Chryseobacterium sp. SCN 40-13]|nr:MAG: hypothetical protein ABS44_09635 [Chryseobacterium sp. SCN 40-13]